MNIEEWRSRRRYYERLEEAETDLKESQVPEGVEGPGFLYPGALTIEENGDSYLLVIANENYEGPLESLEPILYYWAKSEGYWT